MTREEILAIATWRNSDEAEFECFLPVFGGKVEMHILTKNKQAISDRSVHVVNDFIALSSQHLNTIKAFLWEDCKANCEDSSYGFEVPDGKSEIEVNHQEFGVFNGEDAYQKSSLSFLVCESDQEKFSNNYGYLYFDNSWNTHLTTVVMKNGSIIGYGDSGVYIGKYEK